MNIVNSVVPFDEIVKRGGPTWGQAAGWFFRLQLYATDARLFGAILSCSRIDKATGAWICTDSLDILNTRAWLDRKTLPECLERLFAAKLVRAEAGTGKGTGRPYRLHVNLRRMHEIASRPEAIPPYPTEVLTRESRQTTARKRRSGEPAEAPHLLPLPGLEDYEVAAVVPITAQLPLPGLHPISGYPASIGVTLIAAEEIAHGAPPISDAPGGTHVHPLSGHPISDAHPSTDAPIMDAHRIRDRMHGASDVGSGTYTDNGHRTASDIGGHPDLSGSSVPISLELGGSKASAPQTNPSPSLELKLKNRPNL